MSSTYNSTPASTDAQSSREYNDDFDLSHHAQADLSLLSPYNAQTLSSSTSPSYNVHSTPGESHSDYSAYQASELSEIEDPFFGVDFDAGVNRVNSLSQVLFNQTYDSIQNNPPLTNTTLPELENPTSTALLSNSTYPISPIHSSIPNSPSPPLRFNDHKSNLTISQHELKSDLHNTGFRNAYPPAVQSPSTVQLTPDFSGSSRSSGEGFEPSNMSFPEQSPRISVSQWETMHPEDQTEYFPQTGHKRNASGANVERDEDGSWRPDTRTGQAGVHPESRKDMTNTLVPNLKEAEEQRRIDSVNLDIQEWRSQADSHDPDEDDRNESYFPHSSHLWESHSTGHRPEEENNVAPADDDSVSEHENRLVDGQIYYNFKNSAPNEVDVRLMNLSRHWSDAPVMPRITRTNFQQPATSNDAIRRFNENSDTYSIASRAATWGTRRYSDPSIADWESVADGNFLKKLTISKARDNGRSRNGSIFDQGLDRLANFARKRSDSRLKRARSAVNIPEETSRSMNPRKDSQDTLAPPPRTSNYSAKPPPSLNTTIAAMGGTMAAIGTTHTRGSRSGSVGGPATSPKSPLHLHGLTSIIKRARSKSELGSHEKASQPGIAGMWRGTGGPPVAVPASVPVSAPAAVPVSFPPEAEPLQPEGTDLYDEDEDDDDVEGDDMKVEEEIDPIVPNYEGFKAHVRRLNPNMDPRYNWLVSRVAHQQEVRYKNLLEMRVKHSQAVSARSCSAGRHCIALGGNATLLDTKGNPRESDRALQGLQIVTDMGHESDSNPGEGALTEESFPQGVPRPPTRSLPAEFECQLCFKVKKPQKPSDWTKHVHEDVQPFTCTFDKCKEPRSFKRKADWVRHENERHRHLEWWVCQVDDCRHPCYRKDNFLQHLVREHKLPEPTQKTKAAIKKARTTEIVWIMLDRCHHETSNRPQDEPCKFCGMTFGTWKKLTVHLAKHMEHISLPILKLVESRVVDPDTIISPVEQIITPITPAKLEHSPFNMNSISPHSNMGQFSPFDQRPYHLQQVSSTPFLPSQMPQQMYGQNIYQNNLDNHSIEQPQPFPSIASTNMNQINNVRHFGSMDSSLSQVKMEQTRGFGSMDNSYAQMMANMQFNQLPQNEYAMPQQSLAQNFSSAPAVSGYQTSNMHVSDSGFDFDAMTVNTGQPYAPLPNQIPMNRAPGSGSSYGHSPQNMGPPYHYNQQ